LDPSAYQFDLTGGHRRRLLYGWRRHFSRFNPRQKQARLGLRSVERWSAIATLRQAVTSFELQPTASLTGVVAPQAAPDQNGRDLAIEINRSGRRWRLGFRRCSATDDTQPQRAELRQRMACRA
jgi:hypothetical protein